ncbi:MAG: S8 family serine peptidase [Bryobacterales bacterium]|nr:S8 family serine peptidase [Bryobacterales bacterium]
MTSRSLLLVVFAWWCLPAVHAAEFLMRAPAPYVQEIAARFGLAVLQQVPGQELFRVRGPQGVPDDRLMAWVRNYDHGDNDQDDDDDDDVMIEPNASVMLAELAPGHLGASLAPAQDALNHRSTMDFFGDVLWSGYVRQPALTHIRVPAVHAALSTGAGVVAIIDTGIDPLHPALARWLAPGYDFLRDQPGLPSELNDLDASTRSLLNPYATSILDSALPLNPYATSILDQTAAARLDPNRLPPAFGHGTMVAGLVRLVAPRARIMPLKPFSADGLATRFNVIRAIYYAQANGARVINMSLSFQDSSPELELAVAYVSARGVTCVASAGNRGQEVMAYPAGYKEAIGVASSNLLDQRSVFSNFGDNLVRVAAPGEGLITTYPGGKYAAAWGTSFAAPLVSGTVALMLRVKPKLGWEWADAALSEADPTNGGLGSGRLNVYRAVDKARQF